MFFFLIFGMLLVDFGVVWVESLRLQRTAAGSEVSNQSQPQPNIASGANWRGPHPTSSGLAPTALARARAARPAHPRPPSPPSPLPGSALHSPSAAAIVGVARYSLSCRPLSHWPPPPPSVRRPPRLRRHYRRIRNVYGVLCSPHYYLHPRSSTEPLIDYTAFAVHRRATILYANLVSPHLY